ncbi:2,5-diamino-6-(ribosylamino)-4(3H)-pyrimidinone 5'-phosphate reductase [Natronorarus salvus]|uniref:2,5-diamino-6-(ribosylamino)-4(3H)-pyrimidinone 5'-phosphate reductase n=1 Tax=Natronorarus salvus TaxID=3117733 RepID=UPI002F26D32C
MHVVVNAATSADGKLSTGERRQVRISGPEDFARVERLRAESDAVMVGVGTVLADDPRLGLDEPKLRAERESRGDPPEPARVVADSRARIPADARILDGSATTYLLVSEGAPEERLAELDRETVRIVRAGGERVDLRAALAALEADGVRRVMVEGGGELLFSLFSEDLVDELSLYLGSLVIGGRDAPTLADGEGFLDEAEFPDLALREVSRVDDGVLLRYDVE